jgi:type III secretion system OrgA/MxiK family protein
MLPKLLRVMYAPLDYIHPGHFAASSIPQPLHHAVNHTLIQRFGLATAIDFQLQSADLSHLLVQEWHAIGDVAWLLGCKLARGSFAMNGQLLALPGVARQFIELPLACPAMPLAGPLGAADADKIRQHGARYLFLLKQKLPAALAQRLTLMFAPEVGEPDPGVILNRSLLTFAFDYAKNIKH